MLAGGGWWACSCGAVNVGRGSCRECGAERGLLGRLQDEAWLEERDRELRYEAAAAALAAGKPDKIAWAKAEFEALGDWSDSAEMAEKCVEAAQRHETARRKARKGAAIAASAIAALVGCYFLATEAVIPRVRYNDAVALMESGDYDAAIAALEGLDGYGESEEMIDECRYGQAVALMESGDYAGAFVAFGQTTHPDAGELRRECLEMIGTASGMHPIDAGGDNTVAALPDGAVVAVGETRSGQCDVSGWTDVVAVSVGSDHTVGLRSDGTVVATGISNHGSCDVAGWEGVVAVSAGSLHTVGLLADGTVVATGNNHYGQCNVTGWTDVAAVSAGANHTVGLRSDGTVVATGLNANGQCDVSGWTDVTAVSAGALHPVGLRSDGTVVATGDNGSGQCDVSGWTDIGYTWLTFVR